MKNISQLLLLLSFVAAHACGIAPKNESPALSPEELTLYKNNLVSVLKDSLLDESRFKSAYDEYRSVFSGGTDAMVEESLKDSFIEAIEEQFDKLHAISKGNPEEDMERVMDENKKAFLGFASCVGATVCGLFSIRPMSKIITKLYAGESLKSKDALVSILPATALLLAAVGVKKIKSLMNSPQYMIEEDIAILDANFAYVYPHAQLPLSKMALFCFLDKYSQHCDQHQP